MFSTYLALALITKSQGSNKVAGISTSQPQPKTEEASYHLACPFSQAVYRTKVSSFSDQLADSLDKDKVETRAVIVPHHLLARDLIGQALDSINNDYQTIVIIGPNHQNLGIAKIQTTLTNWKTKFGDIEANRQIISDLEKNELAKIEENAFETEHSICSLVSFLKIYFPQSKIIPLILKSNTSINQTKILAEFLAKECQNCLLVASVDFSHNVGQKQAEENDQKSIEILKELSEEKLDQVVCDSKPTLQTLFFYLKEKGIKKGNLINNSNSAEVAGENFREVTSYIIMAF